MLIPLYNNALSAQPTGYAHALILQRLTAIEFCVSIYTRLCGLTYPKPI